MAAPLMLENLAAAVVGLVDAAVVGKGGAAPLAALGGAHAVWGVAMAVPFALGVGSVVVTSRAHGSTGDLVQAVAGVFAAHAAIGAALFAVLLVLGLPALGAMGLDPAALGEARRYLTILAAVPMVAFFAGAARSILLGLGRTRAMLAAGLVGHAVHVALLPPLVLGVGGHAPLGAAGAAVATLGGAVAGGAAGLVLLGRGDVVPSLRGWPRAEVREVVRVGAPAGGEIVLYGLAQAGVLRVAASLGTVPLAALVVLRRALMIPVTLEAGVAQATMARAGRAAGAGEAAEVGAEGRAAGRVALAIAASCAAVFAALPASAARTLADDAATAAAVARLLPLAGVVLLPQAVNIVAGAALRGAGRTGWMFFTQALGIPVVLGATYLLGAWLGLGLAGLLVGLAADEAVRAVLNAWRLRRLARGGAAGRVAP